MKSMRIICSLVTLLLFASVLYSQQTQLHQTYEPEHRVVRLKTERLVLLNSPEQFLELQFIATWPGESRQGPAQRILLELTSRTPRLTYQGKDFHLFVVSEAGNTDLGLLRRYGTHRQLRAELPAIYDFREAIVTRIPITPTAQVLAVNRSGLLWAEILYTPDLQLDELTNLAGAKQLTLKLDSAVLKLTEDQMAIVREFAHSLTVPDEGATSSSAAESLEVPGPALDTSAASLELTLNWLKEQIAANGRVPLISNEPSSTEITEISGCKLTFRRKTLNPRALEDYAVLKPDLEYIVSLSDLNPEGTTVFTSSYGASIKIVTRDSKRTIALLTRQQATGAEFEQRLDYSVSISLRPGPQIFRIQDALKHAIKLCEAKP